MSETTCSFSPATITTSGQSKLTITTTAPGTAAGMFNLFGRADRFLGPGVLLATLLLLTLLTVFSRRRRLRWTFALCLLLALVIAGCGGGGGQSSAPATAPPDPGTPAGTYVVTLTATSSTIAHTVLLTVTVK